MSRNDSSGADAAAAVLTLALLATIAVVALAVALIMATCKELVVIFRNRGFPAQPTRTSQVLWASLAALVGLIVLCGLLVAFSPALLGVAVLLCSLGFLGLVISSEWVDWDARRHEQEQLAALEQLDSYLEPFAPSAPAGFSTNGHRAPTETGVR